jgi:hypothetical protein
MQKMQQEKARDEPVLFMAEEMRWISLALTLEISLGMHGSDCQSAGWPKK